jgi:hypothetical protein
MDAAAFNRHETDLARRLRLRDVVDRKARAPVALSLGLGRPDGLAESAAVIGPLVGEFGRGEQVLGVDDQQQASCTCRWMFQVFACAAI